MVIEDAELGTFDLRYEGYRLKNPALEAWLLASITERGVEEPLEGVEVDGRRILLNGFKRDRCARKVVLGLVPYLSLGEDEATGILAVLRTSNHRSLSILEQATRIDDRLLDLRSRVSRGRALMEAVTRRQGLLDNESPLMSRITFFINDLALDERNIIDPIDSYVCYSI